MSEPLPDITPVQVEFIARQVSARVMIAHENLEVAIRGGLADRLSYDLLVGLKAFLPCYELASYRWPKTWLDAVKDRWLPPILHRPARSYGDREPPKGWWWRRHFPLPPEFEAISIDAVAAGVPFPRGQGPTLHFAVWHDATLSNVPGQRLDGAVQCPKCRTIVKLSDRPTIGD